MGFEPKKPEPVVVFMSECKHMLGLLKNSRPQIHDFSHREWFVSRDFLGSYLKQLEPYFISYRRIRGEISLSHFRGRRSIGSRLKMADVHLYLRVCGLIKLGFYLSIHEM